MIIDLDTPQVSEVIEVMEEFFPHLVIMRVQRLNDRAAPDCIESDAWCETNVGRGGRMQHIPYGAKSEVLSIDTDGLWCRTWGHYGFKNAHDAVAFKLVFG